MTLNFVMHITTLSPLMVADARFLVIGTLSPLMVADASFLVIGIDALFNSSIEKCTCCLIIIWNEIGQEVRMVPWPLRLQNSLIRHEHIKRQPIASNAARRRYNTLRTTPTTRVLLATTSLAAKVETVGTVGIIRAKEANAEPFVDRRAGNGANAHIVRQNRGITQFCDNSACAISQSDWVIVPNQTYLRWFDAACSSLDSSLAGRDGNARDSAVGAKLKAA